MVREHEESTDVLITLLLDLNRHNNFGHGQHSTFEYAVKIAISIARFACYSGKIIQLLGFGKNELHIPPATGKAHYESIAVALAHIQAESDIAYRSAIELANQHIHNGTTLVLFDSRLNPNTPFPLQTSNHRRIDPIWIHLHGASFIDDNMNVSSQRHYSSTHAYHIYRGDDLAQQINPNARMS